MEVGRRDSWWPALAVLVAAVGAGVWGALLGPKTVQLYAPPFVGHYHPRFPVPALAAALAVGVGGWAVAPSLQRAGWRRLLLGTWALAAAWAVVLAATEGTDGFTKPLLLRDDYLHDVPRVGSGFLAGFSDRIVSGPDRWTTHVAGHPPGLLLLLKGMDVLGLGGAWPAAVLFIGAGTSAVVAVLLVVRALVDEPAARACAPFLALVPAAVWVATSADALFLGVTAWGIALLALGRGFLGGLLLGCALLLTYGALPLGLLALVVLRGRSRLLLAVLGVVVPLAAFAAWGFWWPEGFQQTLVRYRAGAGGYRPYEYFVVANLAVLGVVVGPAVAVGLRALRRADPLWRLAGPALVAVAAADLTGTSKGEVERIWLLFCPWLVVATARLRHPRPWLAAQVVTGLVVQVALRSKW